jgi:hypothetical protein
MWNTMALSCQRIHRAFEMKEEIASFLSDDNNKDGADLFYNEDFIHKLAH